MGQTQGSAYKKGKEIETIMDKKQQYSYPPVPPHDYAPVRPEKNRSVTDEFIDYYDMGGLETIDIIQAKLTQEQYAGFLRGTIIKYMCRAGYKQGNLASQDYEKAAYYSTKLAKLYNKN